MRYIVRTVNWSEERLQNVKKMREQIPHLEVHTDHYRDGYRAFIDVCHKVNDTGAVILEDDIALCADFRVQIEAIIADKGHDKVFNFFEKPKVYLKTGYVGGSQFLWMQCIHLPAGLPAKIASYYDDFRVNKPKHWQGMATDCLIAHALTKERVKYWRIRPCLVQHLPFKSVIGSRPINRQSPYFIDDLKAKGLDYDSLQPAE